MAERIIHSPESGSSERNGGDVIISLWHEYRFWIIVTAAIVYYSLQRWLQVKPSRRKSRDVPSKDSKTKASSDLEIEVSFDADNAPREKSDYVPHARDSRQKPSQPRRVTGSKIQRNRGSDPARHSDVVIQPHIFFFTLTETTGRPYSQKLAQEFSTCLGNSGHILAPMIHDLATVEHEDYFEHIPSSDAGKNVQDFYILLIPSYNIDTSLDNFLSMLKETHNDFRIDTAPLQQLAGYSIFGFGDREGWPTEEAGFCSQAIEVDKWLSRLTARRRAFPLGLGDVKSDAHDRFQEWTSGLLKAIEEYANTGSLGEGAPGSGDALESEEEDGDDIQESSSKKEEPSKRAVKMAPISDLEDVGGLPKTPRSTRSSRRKDDGEMLDSSESRSKSENSTFPKLMVPKTSPTYAALAKQGYTIIGSHSGVKICRWTKSALRGRGSCYKFSFYGIASHLCMEMTPSLSCSNKCVFCWRHGTNPVGTSWRWAIDPPEMIFEGAKEGHYKKIKMMKGVPGVRAERFQEAMRIRHCALSLVGEPVSYPGIVDLLALLHREHISSFLVCNAQHPDQLAALKAVTQLYVSIDASNAESLRKIDRPLHRDFWQRFLRCLDIIHEKRFSMRTVYRLTLVKGFNIESEVEGYADLVARGLPCFVEIKGVTYCGTSTSASAGLTMQNVPFYNEVQAFVEALNAALNARGLEYGIAAEHAHSCCALIASRRFYVDDRWHTLIDYEKFFQCLESGQTFTPEDYMGQPTPEWACWGKGGFDPRDQRVDRKGRAIEI